MSGWCCEHACYGIQRFGSINLGGRLSHISDLGVFARLVKTSGSERPPSQKENTVAPRPPCGKENTAEAANFIHSRLPTLSHPQEYHANKII